MYRIDDTTAVSSLPALPADNIGTPGYFTGGNPGASPAVPATRVRFWWLNLIQESLIALLTAAGLSPSKSDSTLVLQAVQILSAGRLINSQYFTSSGTYTPTAGTKSVTVEVQGGGGPGCGAPSTISGQTSQGGNGTSGSYARKRLTSGFTGGVAVTVGAAGIGASGGVGTAGGTSSFGSVVSAAGGNSGNNMGSTAAANYYVGAATQPATPTTGDLNIPGTVPGNNFTVSQIGITAANAVGMFGARYGAGGYGLPVSSAGAANTGGNGQSGIVIVHEFG